ncbi:hypothetical protein KTAU_19800 [Thermogemmatispora aurantia]|uniref:Uncharacterized protein n=1 Tax=Thermogemmatispora aurantia TaxID=2045279 RepID=A0A5J4K716_9CHLR|nr:hypothetical protein KTAU_19800 [Thermogemmatispora aurantia]
MNDQLNIGKMTPDGLGQGLEARNMGIRQDTDDVFHRLLPPLQQTGRSVHDEREPCQARSQQVAANPAAAWPGR